MQKYEKFLIASLFIFGAIGSLIGFAITNSGIGEIRVWANIDIFGLIELILLAAVLICTAFDIYETYDSLKQFPNPKFKVMMDTRKYRNASIFLGLLSVFELGIFFYFTDIYMLPLCFITIILASMFLLHNKLNNYIDNNGILYWGIYYNWDNIKSYEIKDKTLVEINLASSFFGIEYNNVIKLNFNSKDKDNIEKLISEMLCTTDINKENIV